MKGAVSIAAVKTALLLCMCAPLNSQVGSDRNSRSSSNSPFPNSAILNAVQDAVGQDSARADLQAEDELQTGTALTRRGFFKEAIPHLLAARGHIAHAYAADFNLALCYVGTNQFMQAIEILKATNGGSHTVDVENLLAQAYIGNSQPEEALQALQKAATLSPQNEKLYSLVADACMDYKNYGLGIKVVDIGLRNRPQSARLHYERALFLTQLDNFDEAQKDFLLASKLAPEAEIGYLATAQEELFGGNISDAIRVAREGVKKGYETHALLTVLGEALIRSGVSPGQPEFVEAETVLEKAVAMQSTDAASQIALGSLDLISGQLESAIAHLEKARELDPANTSVYAYLAKAYKRQGDMQQAQDALATLQKLNRDQADRISSAPGDRRLGYASGAIPEAESATPHP